MNNIKGLEEFGDVSEKKKINDVYDLKAEIIKAIAKAARTQKHLIDFRTLLAELDNDVAEIRSHFNTSEAVEIIDQAQNAIDNLESYIKRKSEDKAKSGLFDNANRMVKALEKLKDGFLGKPIHHNSKHKAGQKSAENHKPTEHKESTLRHGSGHGKVLRPDPNTSATRLNTGDQGQTPQQPR